MAEDPVYAGTTVARRPHKAVTRRAVVAEAHALGTLGRSLEQVGSDIDEELQGYLQQRERSKVIQTYGDLTTRSRDLMADIMARRGRQAETAIEDATERLENDYRELSSGMSRYASNMFEKFYHSHRNTVLTQAATHQVREMAQADEISKQQGLTNLLELMANGPGMDGLYDDLREKGIRLLAMQYPELEKMSLEDIVQSNYPILVEEAKRYSDALAASHVQAMLYDKSRPNRITASKALLADYSDKGLLGLENKYLLGNKIDAAQDTESAWSLVVEAMAKGGPTRQGRYEELRRLGHKYGLDADVIKEASAMWDAEERRWAQNEAAGVKQTTDAAMAQIAQWIPEPGTGPQGPAADPHQVATYIDELPLPQGQKDQIAKWAQQRRSREGTVITDVETDLVLELEEAIGDGTFWELDMTKYQHGLRWSIFEPYMKKHSVAKAGRRREYQTFNSAISNQAMMLWPNQRKQDREKRALFKMSAWDMYDTRSQAVGGRDLTPAERTDLIHDMQIEGFLDYTLSNPDRSYWQMLGPLTDEDQIGSWRPVGHKDEKGLYYAIPQDHKLAVGQMYEATHPGKRWQDLPIFEFIQMYEIWKLGEGILDR